MADREPFPWDVAEAKSLLRLETPTEGQTVRLRMMLLDELCRRGWTDTDERGRCIDAVVESRVLPKWLKKPHNPDLLALRDQPRKGP